MLLTYSDDRQRFEVQAEYSERGPIRDAGFWWDRGVRKWVSLDPGRAYYLRAEADGPTFKRLEAWSASRDAAIAASRADEPPDGYSAPSPDDLKYFAFQEAGIHYAAKRKACLLGDEMGLGKTIQAIGTLNTLSREEAFPCLIVCPASLKLNWVAEMDKWLVHDATKETAFSSEGFVRDGSTTPSPAPTADVVVVNYELLDRMPLQQRKWGTLIADEAHYAKTLRWEKKAWKGTKRALALQQLTERADRTLFLTGTPMDRPRDLWALLTMLRPDLWKRTSFYSFGVRYCDGRKTRWGWDFTGSSNSDELQRKLRSSVMVRRKKSEVLKDLPAKTRQVIRLEPATGDLLFELELADELREAVDYNVAVDSLISPRRSEAFERISQVRHDTAVRKAPRVAAFCRDLLEQEQKIIVFAHHSDVIEEMRDELEAFNPVVVEGDTPLAERQRAVKTFQDDPSARVFIGQMEAAGTGITLTAARTVVFAELDWMPSRVTQAEDRAHRIGQRDNVQIYHVVLDRSLDSQIVKALIRKQETADQALDDPSADRQCKLF